MTIEEYISQLTKLKDVAAANIIDSGNEIALHMLNNVLEWIDANVEVKDGKLVASPETIAKLNGFTVTFIDNLQHIKVLTGGVSNLLKDLKPIGSLITNYHEYTPIVTKDIQPVYKIMTDEIIDAYSENGMNANIAQPLRDMIFRNIAGGVSLKSVKEQLNLYIKGGHDTEGIVKKYLNQTALQAVDSYSGLINKKLVEKFDFNYYIVSGSLIQTSSPQCRYVINKLGGYFPFKGKEWNYVISLAEDNGLIPGTNEKNLPFNRLHFGCRHEFTPAILTEEEVNKFKIKNKVFA